MKMESERKCDMAKFGKNVKIEYIIGDDKYIPKHEELYYNMKRPECVPDNNKYAILHYLEGIYNSSPERKIVFSFFPNPNIFSVVLTDYKFNTNPFHDMCSRNESEVEKIMREGLMKIDGIKNISFSGNEIRIDTQNGFDVGEIVDRVYAWVNIVYFNKIDRTFCKGCVTESNYIPKNIRVDLTRQR
jgi:hypothetical protein